MFIDVGRSEGVGRVGVYQDRESHRFGVWLHLSIMLRRRRIGVRRRTSNERILMTRFFFRSSFVIIVCRSSPFRFLSFPVQSGVAFTGIFPLFFFLFPPLSCSSHSRHPR